MTEAELKPCPKCGSADLVVNGSDYGWRVNCICGLSGPMRSDSETAIAAWNIRAPSEADVERVAGCEALARAAIEAMKDD